MNSDFEHFDREPFDVSAKMSALIDIREIKKMLLSGYKDRILQAVERTKMYIQNKEGMSHLIGSDITEFLCDAMTPFDAVTCREIFSCLEYLVQHVEFFTQSHSSIVIESLIRSIHFSLKNITAMVNLSDCLNLLVLITEGYNKFDVVPETENIGNILQILPALITCSAMTINNKHQIGCIILNLIQLNPPVWIQDIDLIVVDCIYKWMDILHEISHLDHPYKDNLIFITSYICHFALKTIIFKRNSPNELFTETYDKIKDDLVVKIINFLVEFEVSYLDALPLSVIESDPAKAEIFFQILLCFYVGDVSPQKGQLTHGLGEAGFLQFVTRIISFADFGEGEHLRKLGVCVLSHVVSVLSEDVFQISKTWPESQEYLRCSIQRGFSQLPLDASQWLDVLVDPDSPIDCKISLLFYLYFYCMTSKSQSNLATIYPSIVTLLNLSNGLESSTLLVKVVWFVYVMSKLSCSESNTTGNEVEETNRMVSMLQLQGPLDLVYTHHPALLYWAFSSEVNSNIQLKIVHLWLRNKSSNCKELEDLIENSSDVRFAILDILQNEGGQVLDSTFSTLNSVLVRSENDNLVSSLWFLLPQMLAKYTADLVSAKNLDYIIELCSLKMPENIDNSQLIRIANLIPEVLINSDLISLVPSLTLTLKLLHLATNEDDLRIPRVFLRINAFLEKVIEGIQSNVCEIALISLKILTLLWQDCNKCFKSKRTTKIKITKEILLRTLFSTNIHVLCAALEFLQQILVTGFGSNVFDIAEFDLDFVEILFFEVENICIKDLPIVSDACWMCLKGFLLLDSSFRGTFSKLQLFSDPLLHEAINFNLAGLQESREMKDFLNFWLERNVLSLNDRCFSRKIHGKYFAETVENIIEQLRKDLRKEDKTLYEKVLRCVGCEE